MVMIIVYNFSTIYVYTYICAGNILTLLFIQFYLFFYSVLISFQVYTFTLFVILLSL